MLPARIMALDKRGQGVLSLEVLAPKQEGALTSVAPANKRCSKAGKVGWC